MGSRPARNASGRDGSGSMKLEALQSKNRILPQLLTAMAFVVGLLAPGLSQAQTVEGRVIDAQLGGPIEGVSLTLLNDAGVQVAATESDEDGRFYLAARLAGLHTLTAERLGYAPMEPLDVRLEREILEVELQLARSPIELDPLTVVARRHDPRHDATFEGALARREQLPSVGPNRVVLRTDPEFAASGTVLQVARWFVPYQGCMIVWQNGLMRPDAQLSSRAQIREFLDELPAGFWEGLEYYRRWNDAPLGLRDIPHWVDMPSGCSVLALWPRMDHPDQPALWKRALGLGGIVAVFYLIRSLLMDG
ncbi:MAG: carboxypeptidase regulatory-like domain-containing protein [Gemmatimonadales bacterium]|nr:MAG: carboxypeptidase regulatory-like domain-containing protein [Gemmatimonadales bacterium]